jgi:hypothetical protein
MRRHLEQTGSPAFISHRTLCRLHSVHARILRDILGTCADPRRASDSGAECGRALRGGEADDASPLASKSRRLRFIVQENSLLMPQRGVGTFFIGYCLRSLQQGRNGGGVSAGMVTPHCLGPILFKLTEPASSSLASQGPEGILQP